MNDFTDLRQAVEALSGGRNTVILDNIGMPSIVVPIPLMRYANVLEGGTQEPLPGFLLSNVEQEVIYLSKYQNIIVNDRAYSLPFKDPGVGIDFDTAVEVSRNKGVGWHLQTNALWAAIALWSKRNGTLPRGNNDSGKDAQTGESGILSEGGRTAGGSGPLSWYHNHHDTGVADLNGNVREWCGGLRLANGEIQIIPYGNAMRPDCDMSVNSGEWRAILPDGSLAPPGTPNTLKFDYTSASIGQATPNFHLSSVLDNPQTGNEYGRCNFGALEAAAGINVPVLLQGLGIFPAEADGFDNQGDFLFRNIGERLPQRGGAFDNGSRAGVFGLSLNNTRTKVSERIGFRAAYIEFKE